MFKWQASISLLLLAATTGASARTVSCGGANTVQAEASCPPQKFDSVSNFDIEKYISAPWYIQKQLPLQYQPEDELFCVRALYTPLDPSKGPQAGLLVRNYANKGKVNGPGTGSSGAAGDRMRLIALPDDSGTGSTAASKLMVGPESLTRTLPPAALKQAFGPYWIVAVGPSSDPKLGYDWAIVSGGSPTVQTGSGCLAGSNRFGGGEVSETQYFGGLWFFARKPVDPEATAKMEETAKKLGLDTSKLLKVQQEGCEYKDA